MRALQVLAWMVKQAELKKDVTRDKPNAALASSPPAPSLPAAPKPAQPVASRLTNLATKPYVEAGKMLGSMGSAAMPALKYVKNRYVHPGMNFVNGDYDLSRINKPAYGDPRWEEDYNTAKTYAFDPDPSRRLNAVTKMNLDSYLDKNTKPDNYANAPLGSVPLTDRIKAQESLYNNYWDKARDNYKQDMLYGAVDAANKITAPGMQSVWNLHPKANQKIFEPANPNQAIAAKPPTHPSTSFNEIVNINNSYKNFKKDDPSYAGFDFGNNFAANYWATPHEALPHPSRTFSYYPKDSANAYILKNIINSPHRLKITP